MFCGLHATIKQSTLGAGTSVRPDAFSGLCVISKIDEHYPKVTPPEQVANWLPLVRIVISDLKTFMLGTFHNTLNDAIIKPIEFTLIIANERLITQLSESVIRRTE